MASVLTNGGGDFLLDGIQVGVYKLNAVKPHVGQASLPGVEVSAGQTTDVGTVELVGPRKKGPRP